MKNQKGLNSREKGVIDYDGWHISIIDDEIIEVTPNEEARIDLQTKILFCERYAKQRFCRLRFKLFLSRDLSRLESVLKVQGYRRRNGQVLMYRDSLDLPLVRRGQIEIRMFDRYHEEFNERRQQLLSEEIAYGQEECICELVVNKYPVGSGFATIKSGHMGIFNVYVTEEYRGNGYGEHLLRALFYWGRENGARTAYLNVDERNEIAIGLYGKLGFKIESEICIYEKYI